MQNANDTSRYGGKKSGLYRPFKYVLTAAESVGTSALQGLKAYQVETVEWALDFDSAITGATVQVCRWVEVSGNGVDIAKWVVEREVIITAPAIIRQRGLGLVALFATSVTNIDGTNGLLVVSRASPISV